jgi:ribosomal protein L19E
MGKLEIFGGTCQLKEFKQSIRKARKTLQLMKRNVVLDSTVYFKEIGNHLSPE